MDWITPAVGLFGTLVGAVIASSCSLIATKILISDQRRLMREEKEQRLKEAKEEKEANANAILCALYHEIRSVWARYSDGVGKLLDAYTPNSDGFRYVFPIIDDYFPVFNRSVVNLGLIPDVKLRYQIIAAYTLGKSLIDTFKYNNDLIIRWQKAEEEVFLNARTATQNVAKLRAQELAAYAGPLKDLHNKCTIEVEELIRVLSAYADR